MLKDLVGYRFAPTGEELINHYLKNKILGKTWLVDEAISEINICSYDPIDLPSLSKIKSDDLVWYFFSPKEYTSENKKITKRTTASGYWKATGVTRIIKDKKESKREIGVKKTLVYHEGRISKAARTPWVMHEYHITCLPSNLRNYVISQVMYKGEDEDVPFGGKNQSELCQSLVSDVDTVRTINIRPELEQQGQDNFDNLFVDELMNPMNEQEPDSLWDVLDPNKFTDNNHNNNPSVQPSHLAPNDDEFLGELRHVDRGQVEHLFSDEDFISTPTFMIENCNYYVPKQPLSGFIVDYSSDSDDDDDDDDDDAQSTSELSFEGTSSPGDDSISNSNKHFLQTDGDEIISTNTESCNDLPTYAELSISTKTKTQKVKQDTSRAVNTSMEKKSCIVKTEKKGLFITEEAMERNQKISQCIYLMSSMIGFILLLGIIGNVISVFLSVRT